LTQRLLLADDHPIFRAGIRRTLETEPDLEILAEVGDGASCVAQAAVLRPDVIIADVSMPNMTGFDIADWARENLPECRTIIVSMHSASAFVEKAIDSGAFGFVAKEDAVEEILAAIRFDGEGFYRSLSAGGRNVRDDMETVALPQTAEQETTALLKSLTRSELKVLTLLCNSLTSREIADALGLSPRTVQTHRNNIAIKLDIRGPHRLLEFAIRNANLIAQMSS